MFYMNCRHVTLSQGQNGSGLYSSQASNYSQRSNVKFVNAQDKDCGMMSIDGTELTMDRCDEKHSFICMVTQGMHIFVPCMRG